MLMNGRPLGRATNAVRQGARQVLSMPVDDADKIEALFLRALARKPTGDETGRLLPLVASAKARADSGSTEDIFWALLNSRRVHLQPLIDGNAKMQRRLKQTQLLGASDSARCPRSSASGCSLLGPPGPRSRAPDRVCGSG
jgi:hypothetical protein